MSAIARPGLERLEQVPVNFTDEEHTGEALIQIFDDVVKQNMDGFGATLSKMENLLMKDPRLNVLQLILRPRQCIT